MLKLSIPFFLCIHSHFYQFGSSLKVKSITQTLMQMCNFWNYRVKVNVQWGKKVFSQPPVLQVFPLKKMKEACHFHQL